MTNRVTVDIKVNGKSYTGNYVFSKELNYSTIEMIYKALESFQQKMHFEIPKEENKDEGF